MKKVWKKAISVILCVALLSVFAMIPASAGEIAESRVAEEPYATCTIMAYRHLSSNTFYLSTKIDTNMTDVTQYTVSYAYKLYDYDGALYGQYYTAPAVYAGPEIIGYSPEVLDFPEMSSSTSKIEVSMQVVLFSTSNGIVMIDSGFHELSFNS